MILILIFFDEFLGAFRANCAGGGKDEDVFFVAFSGEFNSRLGADEDGFGVFFSEVTNASDRGCIAGDDDYFGAPVDEFLGVFNYDFFKLVVGFFAVRTIFGVGDVEVLGWKIGGF